MTEAATNLDTYSRFSQACAEGHRWERWIAELFSMSGLAVEIPEQRVRGEFERRARFVGSVDLLVEGKPIEVKSRRTTLAKAIDPLIVAPVNEWQAHDPRPFAIVIVFREDGQIRAVPSGVVNRGRVVTVFDREKGRDRECLAVRLSQLRTLDRLIRALRTR